MPIITITFTDSDDSQSVPQSYTLPQDVAEKLILVAEENERDPMRQARVMLAEAMELWKPRHPAKITATGKTVDPKAPDKDEVKGKGKGPAPAKDANGTPVSTTIGASPLMGTGLS